MGDGSAGAGWPASRDGSAAAGWPASRDRPAAAGGSAVGDRSAAAGGSAVGDRSAARGRSTPDDRCAAAGCPPPGDRPAAAGRSASRQAHARNVPHARRDYSAPALAAASPLGNATAWTVSSATAPCAACASPGCGTSRVRVRVGARLAAAMLSAMRSRNWVTGLRCRSSPRSPSASPWSWSRGPTTARAVRRPRRSNGFPPARSAAADFTGTAALAGRGIAGHARPGRGLRSQASSRWARRPAPGSRGHGSSSRRRRADLAAWHRRGEPVAGEHLAGEHRAAERRRPAPANGATLVAGGRTAGSRSARLPSGPARTASAGSAAPRYRSWRATRSRR